MLYKLKIKRLKINKKINGYKMYLVYSHSVIGNQQQIFSENYSYVAAFLAMTAIDSPN